MTLAYDVAFGDIAGRDVARIIARDRLVERRISRFREPLKTRVRALARRHPHIGDLAASFPALIAALALPRRGIDAESVLARVVAGAPLKTLAQMAGVPLWLRVLKPEALAPAALPALPDTAWFSHRISNHFPHAKLTPAWLDAIGRAYAYGDEAIALWIAREWAKKPMPKCKPAHYCERDDLRLVSLWAWHSLHGETPELMEGRFTLEMEMNAANLAAREWRENIGVHLDFGTERVWEPWLPGGSVGPYELVPVRTAQELIEEAREMKHCIRTFSSSVVHGGAQVWSVYHYGDRVATLMVGRRYPSPFLEVLDLRGPMNEEVPLGMWRHMLDWLRAREAPAASNEFRDRAVCRKVWTRLWRRYWLAKRRIPDWLPLAPDLNALWGL